MTTSFAETADIILPALQGDEVPDFQKTVLAQRVGLDPYATPEYRAVQARRGLLYYVVVAAAMKKKVLTFNQARQRMLAAIFGNENASDVLITGWIEEIRKQWEIIRVWINDSYRDSLPAIDGT